MPTYSLPGIDGQNQQAEGQDIPRAVTKAFMSNPNFARKFMNNANEAMAPADNYGLSMGTPVTGGGDVSGYSGESLLARVLAAEAGGHPEDQPHVASVIMNRVASPDYPNTLKEVLLDRGQFSALNGLTGYAGGEGANDQWKTQPPENLVNLASMFANGAAPTTDALNYYNPDDASPVWGGDGFERIGKSAHVFGNARR